MCGIAGFNWPDGGLVKRMAEMMRHRGPDDQGDYLDGQVSLGHRRLSIIDLSEKGRQPMAFEHLVIVYNGEVYNFPELRQELETLGYRFGSGTDTEVILYSYHRWGPACVEKFNGMWAFCIYDKKENVFFLSRDRFGVKPLYYYFDGRRFIFASELKALRPHGLDLKVNVAGLNYFFYQKYIGWDLTIYDNCHRVRPGENLMFNLARKQIHKSRYYDLEQEIAAAAQTPLEQRLQSVEGILADAVEKRLIADVPVGGFLSGGVDSSLISALVARRHDRFDTFSIGFKDRSYDEIPYSRQVSAHIGTEHHVRYLEMDESLIETVVGRMDEPFGDASLLPTCLLSEMTGQTVKAALSGDGGDEIFGGYDSYLAYKIARYIPSAVVRGAGPPAGLLRPSEKKLSLTFKMKKFIEDYSPDAQKRHLDWMATFTDPRRRVLLRDNFLEAEAFMNIPREDSLLGLQLNDIQNYLPEDILKKVDMASMAASLEVRVPFLDYRLVPVVLSLPDAYKIRYFRTKWLLKELARPYLPRPIVRRKKRGFTVPIRHWLKESHLLREYLADRRYFDHDLMDYDHIQGLLKEHNDTQKDHARSLWLVFVFNYWRRRQARNGDAG